LTDPSPESLYDFIVVGGGVGGLVLARRLVLGGAERVVLVEASDHLGGTVSRHEVAGIELDAGAESFATRGGTVVKLLESLGLGDDVVEPNPEGAWLQPAVGPPFRLPENSLLGIPGSPLARDVVAIIGQRAAVRAFAEVFLPAGVGAKAQTLGELVRKRMGPVVLDRLVRPIVRGVHSADPDDLPLDQVAPGLRRALFRTGSLARAVLELRATSARAGSAVAGIRGGVFRMVDRLQSDLERFGVRVLLGTAASEAEPESVRVGDETLFGRVVAAAPGLVGEQTASGTRVILATLVVEQPLLDAEPRGTGLLVAEGATGVRARALTHATAKWHWLAEQSGGRHVLRLSYDATAENLALGEAQLRELARTDAAALMGVFLPQEAVLGFARVQWYRPPRVTTTPDDIPLVGESIAGTGLASVVARSEALAAQLLADAEG
jgi:oxygen-dependent protoporphyrinogen oxidase